MSQDWKTGQIVRLADDYHHGLWKIKEIKGERVICENYLPLPGFAPSSEWHTSTDQISAVEV